MAVTTTAQKLGYWPGLDGLRGVAVLLVVGAHAEVPGFSLGGAVGVEVFFVLSGFLITTLLLERPVDLRGFYVRRARRLLPALVVLAVLGVVAAVAGNAETLAGVGAGASYSSNLARTRSVDLGWLNHLWSLAVEEHFYLLWPLVVLACGRRDRWVGAVAGAGAVLTALWRYDLGDHVTWDRIYHGTDTRITGILVGAVLSVLVRSGLRGRTGPMGYTALAVLLLWVQLPASEPFRFGFLAVDCAAALVVVGAVTSGRGAPVLAWCGGISYALYLWHYPVVEAFDGRWPVVSFSLSVLTAWVSTRYVEARWRVGNDARSRDADPVAGSERTAHLAALGRRKVAGVADDLGDLAVPSQRAVVEGSHGEAVGRLAG